MTKPNMPDGRLRLERLLDDVAAASTAGKSYSLAQRPLFSSMKTSTSPFLNASNMVFSSRIIGEPDLVVIVEAALGRECPSPSSPGLRLKVRRLAGADRCRAGRGRCRSSASASTCRSCRRRWRASAGSGSRPRSSGNSRSGLLEGEAHAVVADLLHLGDLLGGHAVARPSLVAQQLQREDHVFRRHRLAVREFRALVERELDEAALGRRSRPSWPAADRA